MNYDIDLGPVLISDWYHQNPFGLLELELEGHPPPPASTLLQGKGIYCGTDICTGSYYVINLVKGTTYKLSIVNAGISSQFTFWIDGHIFTVVGMDFVPIEGYNTNTLNVAIGTHGFQFSKRIWIDDLRSKIRSPHHSECIT
jgi:hypothetical protein